MGATVGGRVGFMMGCDGGFYDGVRRWMATVGGTLRWEVGWEVRWRATVGGTGGR